jgi:hypothetical protein
VRVTIALLTLGVATAAGAQTAAPVPRLVTLPGAHCDSTRADSLADSAITPLDSVDVRPTMRSMDVPVVPDSLRHTYQGTVLELVIDRMGQLDPCRVRVVAETSLAWTAAVLKALKKARYSPAQRHGVAVAVRAIQRVPYYGPGRP